MDFLSRGIAEIIGKEQLEQALKAKKKLRVKFGADPTAPDLHLGTAVALRKLRQFQDLGHKVIFVVGDYTAQIGDPSGRSKTRPILSEKEIRANAKTYFQQVGKILNVKKTEIVYNSKWFSKMKFSEVIKLASGFTMQRILERNDFTNRVKAGAEVRLHELLYPAMQAYDSIQIKADVELGGTDQKFNMLAGRDLQRHMGLPEQIVITVPLLVGTDGTKKMSKSYNNYIGITEHPEIMFGEIMSVPDELINQYYELCADAERTIPDPREAKLTLGKIIVGMYHGEKAAQQAQDEFIRVVSHKEAPAEIPTVKIGIKSLTLADLLVNAKLATSKSEARRLVEQGGVKIGNERQNDPNAMIHLEKVIVLQVGKRKFLRVTF